MVGPLVEGGVGHDYPCPAEAAVDKCAANVSPMLSPGNPSGKTRMVTAARRRRDRAKFAVPPNLHRLAYSRGNANRCGDVLGYERKTRL